MRNIYKRLLSEDYKDEKKIEHDNYVREENKDPKTIKEEKVYAQCEYYYPSNEYNKSNDSLDNLSYYGQFNRLMFSIK